MIRKNGLPSDKLLPVLRDILRPALIWAAHFTFVYAALSAACAPRGLTDPFWASVLVLVVTPPAALWAIVGARRRGRSDFERAARWSSTISALAILFNAAPVVLMGGCG